jgi:hypothetical protein
MWLLLCVIAFGGPLMVVWGAVLLLLPAGFVSASAAQGVYIAAFSLLAVMLTAAAGTSAVFRWCFDRAPARGGALLSGLVVALFFLSHETTLGFLGDILTDGALGASAGVLLFEVIIESGTLVGIAVAIACLVLLILELPLRWSDAGSKLISDGGFRTLRWVGVVIFLFLTGAVLRDEGAVRLARAFSGAVN